MKLKAIAWAVSGGGAYLRECVNIMEYLKKELNFKVTVFLTKWGYEVSRVFGVLSKLRSIAPGGYYEEFLAGDEGMYYIGRINLKKYSALIIAPATANTIAKIVCGVADTVATALFAQAEKSLVPVIILPTDIPSEEGYAVTELPCYVDRSTCSAINCNVCVIPEICPVKAIVIIESYPRIDLSKCIGCELCEKTCPHGAVKCWEKIKLIPRLIDLENIKKLSRMRNVTVVKNPWDIVEKIKTLMNIYNES
jgi:dihydromethanopterin reductase (acceptor)